MGGALSRGRPGPDAGAHEGWSSRRTARQAHQRVRAGRHRLRADEPETRAAPTPAPRRTTPGRRARRLHGMTIRLYADRKGLPLEGCGCGSATAGSTPPTAPTARPRRGRWTASSATSSSRPARTRAAAAPARDRRPVSGPPHAHVGDQDRRQRSRRARWSPAQPAASVRAHGRRLPLAADRHRRRARLVGRLAAGPDQRGDHATRPAARLRAGDGGGRGRDDRRRRCVGAGGGAGAARSPPARRRATRWRLRASCSSSCWRCCSCAARRRVARATRRRATRTARPALRQHARRRALFGLTLALTSPWNCAFWLGAIGAARRPRRGSCLRWRSRSACSAARWPGSRCSPR